jgi:hypothetical protein
MTETNSSQSDSDCGSTTQDMRERAQRLQQKVGDLSKTLDRVEQTLAEGADESEK